jgi:dienelactone hydrolase
MRQFYRGFVDFNPLPVLGRLSIPSLWIYGGRDENVPVTESAATLDRFKAQGKDVTVRIFGSADHALYVMPQDSQPFRWPGLVPGYLDTMTDWLLGRVNPKR